jgi:hypothetical protein
MSLLLVPPRRSDAVRKKKTAAFCRAKCVGNVILGLPEITGPSSARDSKKPTGSMSLLLVPPRRSDAVRKKKTGPSPAHIY